MVINIIIGVCIPAYILLITVPSFLLNGLIVFTFAKAKELQTPSNLISVHLSIIGLLITILYSPFSIAAFINVMTSCDCTVLYYYWFFGHIFHYGLYPLNILVLNISYFVIIKFSFSALTLRRALIGILIIWLISILGNLPGIFISPPQEFIECCQTVCINGSVLCNTTLDQSFTPRDFSNESKVYYHVRDFIIILIPAVIVFVTSSIAYCIYKKSSMRSSLGLEVRLLLLPVIMTLTIGGYLLGQDAINWRPLQTSGEDYPGILVFLLLHMLWDINGVFFPILILFFNVKIRRKCYQIIMCKLNTVDKAINNETNIPPRKQIQSNGTVITQFSELPSKFTIID